MNPDPMRRTADAHPGFAKKSTIYHEGHEEHEGIKKITIFSFVIFVPFVVF